MTKKRFVKLAMSHGMSRNEANQLAQSVLVYGSYDTMYAEKRATWAVLRLSRSFWKLGVTAAEAARSIGRLCAIGIDLKNRRNQ